MSYNSEEMRKLKRAESLNRYYEANKHKRKQAVVTPEKRREYNQKAVANRKLQQVSVLEELDFAKQDLVEFRKFVDKKDKIIEDLRLEIQQLKGELK